MTINKMNAKHSDVFLYSSLKTYIFVGNVNKFNIRPRV